MGSQYSMAVTYDVDSVANPGTKVCMCEDLDGIADYDTLMEATVAFLRDPVDAVMAPFLKSLDIEEHGPDDFTIKITLSRDKIIELTGADPSTIPEGDAVNKWQRCTIDRAAGTLRTQCFRLTGSEPKCEQEYNVVLNKAPLAFEGYLLTYDEDGNKTARLTDKACGDGLLWTINPVVRLLKEVKVKCTAGQPSRVDPSLTSVMSEPLDAHTSVGYIVDKYWEETVSGIEASEGFKVVTKEPDELKVLDPRGGEMTWIFDKGAKEILMKTGTGGEPMYTVTSKFHEDPLQLEVWTTDKGVRGGTTTTAREQSITLSKALVRAQSWFG